MKSKLKRKRWWKIPLIVVCVILVTVIVYVAYVFLSYNRISDNQTLDASGEAVNAAAKTDTEYTAMTYNAGFGAYTPDFTFFMDGGKQSWANSKESVINCTNGYINVINEYNADIVCMQEVDRDSTRSYHVDQAQQILDALDGVSSTFAVNYHSAFLFYPIYQPHGASFSGLLTISDMQITGGTRRSLPISEGFKKIVDLDRCYAINYIKVDNGKELVVINAHLSAYGTNGDLQQQQLNMLFADMEDEYKKGSYVICAGDFNHDFTGNSKDVFNENTTEEHSWAAPFPDELIPEHFSKVTDYASGVTVPSCRNCDKPYGPDCYTVIVDGFIVSDNVDAIYTDVIDTQFAYTDHNPVLMKFKLKK